MTARDVLTALRRHHARMQTPWVVLREAFGIDALAISQSGSRDPKYRRVSYEIKVSRSDYRRELARWPQKAAVALRLGHQFYFAIPAGMLTPGERTRRPQPHPGLWVPEPAGLIEVNADRVCEIRMRAAVTDAPAWTDREAAYLVSYAHRPGAEAHTEWKAADLNARMRATDSAKKYAEQQAEKVVARLAELGAALVQPGSRWKVNWLMAPHVPMRVNGELNPDPRCDLEECVCEVLGVVSSEVGLVVKLKRTDGPERHDRTYDGVPLGRFLLEAEKVEGDGEVVDLRRRRARRVARGR